MDYLIKFHGKHGEEAHLAGSLRAAVTLAEEMADLGCEIAYAIGVETIDHVPSFTDATNQIYDLAIERETGRLTEEWHEGESSYTLEGFLDTADRKFRPRNHRRAA